MIKKIIFFLIILFIILPVFSETFKSDKLNQGLEYFNKSDFNNALLNFRDIILDPNLDSLHGDAYFWIAKSYMALHSYKDAEKNFIFFMQNYPDNSYYHESIYQNGRLLFLQKNFESAIQVFYTYIELFKDTIYTANSYFWIGESLYSLGHFDDAFKIFNHVLTKYPTSYKVEAAKYRISLIDLKKREDVLLDLIKMSHEEYLKTLEEFQIREKTYEQAINAYQKKYASFATMDSQEQINELNNELIKKNKELQSFKDTITELNNKITSLQSETELLQSSDITSEETSSASVKNYSGAKADELLKIKTEALKLKEYYLNWLFNNLENDQ